MQFFYSQITDMNFDKILNFVALVIYVRSIFFREDISHT